MVIEIREVAVEVMSSNRVILMYKQYLLIDWIWSRAFEGNAKVWT